MLMDDENNTTDDIDTSIVRNKFVGYLGLALTAWGIHKTARTTLIQSLKSWISPQKKQPPFFS